MNNNNQNSGGNFLNAFIFGAIVGAALVFFLGTKKGKEILKAITEEGKELSELLGDDDILTDEEFEEPHGHCENCEPMEKSDEMAQHEEIVQPKMHSNGNGRLVKIKKPQHFFKGIQKKRIS